MRKIYTSFALLLCISAIFIINFYRMPAGCAHNLANIVVAPSYGTVKEITYTRDTVHITTFLSPKDVHMQYVPVSGVLTRTAYDRTGRYHLAYKLGKSRYNEKRIHVFDTAIGTVTVMQIAGYLTRHIESYLPEPGNAVAIAQPLGFIHLGSRVDIHLPRHKMQLLIKPGQKLKGGCTVIANYT